MALASLYEIFLGYSALFLCIGFGILFLRRVAGGVVGPEYWGTGFFFNSAGFLCWAATATDRPWLFFTAGEIFHMLGFVIMVGGAYRFTGNAFKRWNVYALFGFTSVWAVAMLLMPHYGFASFFLIMALRMVLFVWAGCMVLKFTPSHRTAGRRLAGWSLIAWGVYVLLFPFFFQFPSLIHPAFGFLVGFHVLAALGLVVLVVDRVRVRAEDSEDHSRRLEGFLPICSHCKKIRDDNDIWQPIESYIRDRSDAEFSHGICPECLKVHYPEFNSKT
jgi:hypothetical protein